jgi:hypothetical protein
MHEIALEQHPSSVSERPVEAYPPLRLAAKLIGVSASTLSRRTDLERIPAGRETRIPAGEVVRLAYEYRKRRVSRVAGELVELAAQAGDEVQNLIAAEVDDALQREEPRDLQLPDAAGFVAEAHRLLPAALARQVEMTLGSREELGSSAVGWSPSSDD